MRRLSLFWFTYFCGLGVFFPYYTLYLHENAGLDGMQVGLVLATLPLVGAIAQPLWGYLADRTGARSRILILVAAGTAVGCAALADDARLRRDRRRHRGVRGLRHLGRPDTAVGDVRHFARRRAARIRLGARMGNDRLPVHRRRLSRRPAPLRARSGRRRRARPAIDVSRHRRVHRRGGGDCAVAAARRSRRGCAPAAGSGACCCASRRSYACCCSPWAAISSCKGRPRSSRSSCARTAAISAPSAACGW